MEVLDILETAQCGACFLVSCIAKYQTFTPMIIIGKIIGFIIDILMFYVIYGVSIQVCDESERELVASCCDSCGYDLPDCLTGASRISCSDDDCMNIILGSCDLQSMDAQMTVILLILLLSFERGPMIFILVVMKCTKWGRNYFDKMTQSEDETNEKVNVAMLNAALFNTEEYLAKVVHFNMKEKKKGFCHWCVWIAYFLMICLVAIVSIGCIGMVLPRKLVGNQWDKWESYFVAVWLWFTMASGAVQQLWIWGNYVHKFVGYFFGIASFAGVIFLVYRLVSHLGTL
eukprot:345064_1